ncbi:TPA: phage antirepressor KilAC domain-containing protein [Clostridioides difficile]|uniref:phage antirepressor n=1 Tax=Clostridioides difficile TaxID=1496 RepID=UPI0003B28C0F|nr:phage antirepressor KilAC domain-containing protein [Clostridioides difficile]MBG0269159.1 phage antirepressor KilAC domain-containing protein [Clostridioides difficile]MBY1725983.1 phage antirepressor KilAC domain-containing protein [Clostridioides difficile]MBZ1202746.1 phage antirepressor KilAC domain-containing protein [Clostridioides difficile]MDB0341037.1 phage repressor protein/antirepressor Ant [Clostridioides difficile]MDC9313216.1 phage antirepressor KilAC domain-containing protei
MGIINRENVNEIMSFEESELSKKFEGMDVEIIELNGELLFELYSTGAALGYTRNNPSGGKRYLQIRRDRIDNVIEKAEIKPLDRSGTKYLTEPQLYDFMLEAKTAKCRPFKKWVTNEVLPTIRKHGAYMTNEALEKAINDPDWTIQLLTELKKERATKEKLRVEQEKNKPKLELANAIESSSSSILIAQLSKILNQNGVDIGQNRLFEWMRNNEYLIRKKRADHNTPTQKSMDLKVLEVSESTGVDKDGNTIVRYTPIVTGKGQIYFLNKILKENSQVLKRFMINNDYIKGVMVEIGKTYAIYDHEYYGFIGILKSVRNEKIRVEEIGDVSSSRDIPICMIDYIEEASKEDINKYLSK